MSARPILIIVHGLPATGKTSISKKIADDLKLPWISKDTYKERIFEVLSPESTDVDFSRKLGAVSSELMYIIIEDLLNKGISCVAESYFAHKFTEPVIKRVLKESKAHVIQIFTTCEHDKRLRRYEERANSERHPAHMDVQRIENRDKRIQSDSEHNKPLDIGGELIEIDTTDFEKVSMDEVIQRVNSLMER